jgi:hypothetical protein
MKRGDCEVLSAAHLPLSYDASTRLAALPVPSGLMGERAASASERVRVEPLDFPVAKACGELCAARGTANVVDASVIVVAKEHGGAIVTSDVEDLRRLDPTAWDFVQPGRTPRPTDNMAVADYATLSREIGGELSVTLNFGSGTAAEAANYVRYLTGADAMTRSCRRAFRRGTPSHMT